MQELVDTGSILSATAEGQVQLYARVCVCIEIQISSVNHPGWVSLEGRDKNRLPSGKSQQGNKVMQIKGLEKDYSGHVCPSL